MSFNVLSLQRLTDDQIATIHAVDKDVNIRICKAAEAVQYIEETDILLAWGLFDLTPLLEKAPRLKWVQALSSGVDNMLTPEFMNTNILLTNARGIHGIPIAEHVLGMMLNFTRGITIAYDQQKAKQWKHIRQVDEMYEKSIAIIGLGSIGREIAKRVKNMGMRVLATKQTPTTELFVDHLYTPEELPLILAEADFVVVTLPLTPETTNLFTLKTFQKMKKTAYFINVARGAIVNEPDLIAALNSDTIKGAALDVFAEEPLPESSPLWDMPNIFITPHIAAQSPYYIDRALKIFTENLNRFLHQADMLNIIDKQKGY
ncbi:D-2-hydroxyacid dehydrogenase [Propionispira raffinosivorans]|uniref:D-2-hydroxyacid dehydrogenase n=1 Tax=Propionispira raffinosivorans TaxID=86959 RepID=UPI000381EA40|nr:D-2-hydroxyacid dehydrogenase [Propionispira raffinosivorans]